MAAPRFVPLLALALTATLTPRADATCTEVEGACLCTSTSGDVWDLTDLQTPEPTTTGDISGCALPLRPQVPFAAQKNSCDLSRGAPTRVCQAPPTAR